MTPYALDDAAAHALYVMSRDHDQSLEHMGLLFEKDGIQRTPTKTKGQQASVGGTFAIPNGSLRGLFHNHPNVPQSHGREVPRDSGGRAEFPPHDVKQARGLGVPSYIGVDEQVFRYDPQTGRTEEVLAQIPIAELKKLYLAQKLTNP